MDTLFRKLPLVALMIACMALGAALTGTALAYQGHMWSARTALSRAQAQLRMASDDKAGHRVDAMKLVEDAIEQVNEGIAAGAR